jgi:hypothetical protein
VLARAAGLPSRVVVGFDPGSGGRDRVIRIGDTGVGEIYFRDLGWVLFDPNPRERSKMSTTSRSEARSGGGGTQPGGGSGDAAGGGTAGEAGPRSDSRGPVFLVLPVQPLLLFLGGLPLLRMARRRRLRRGAGSYRIQAAWTEVLVAMWLAGLPHAVSATATDVVAGLAQELPEADPARLRRLGRLGNAAGYGGPVTSGDADFTVGEAVA